MEVKHAGRKETFIETGGDLFRPHWLSQLAEAYMYLGQPKDSLAAIEEAFDVMNATEEYFHHAKLHQIKGMVLLECSGDWHAEAESCFQQALEIARAQEVKVWELRSAMSLSRLWQQQGKCNEAREVLAEVYHWFTEGHDTADLQDAKAQLEALS